MSYKMTQNVHLTNETRKLLLITCENHVELQDFFVLL